MRIEQLVCGDRPFTQSEEATSRQVSRPRDGKAPEDRARIRGVTLRAFWLAQGRPLLRVPTGPEEGPGRGVA